MAFGSFDDGDEAPLAEINMVPLIDVMLVLLIIFIITAPLLTNSVKVELPKEQTTLNEVTAATVTVVIDEKGGLYWNEEKIDREQLTQKLSALAKSNPDSEVQIRADHRVTYAHVAEVMGEASRQQLTKLSFVSDPSAK